MPRVSNLDKFKDVMFTDIAQLTDFSQVEIEQLLRYRYAFTECLNNPAIADVTLRDALIQKFGISQAQAYRDIFSVKVLLPSVRNAGKQWVRYIVEEELKQAIQDAKDLSDEADEYKDKAAFLNARVKAIGFLGKYSKLDKEDDLNINWEDIIPVSIEPTNDVSVLGIKALPNKNEYIQKLYEKYKGEIEIEDIDFEEEKDERD
jgi:hypothetical protein